MSFVAKYISHQPDSLLIWITFVLVLIGLLMLFTASSWISLEKTSKENSGFSSQGSENSGFSSQGSENSGFSSQGSENKSATYYLFHQILYGLLPGVALAYLLSKISLTFLKKTAFLLLLLGFILLSLVFFSKFSFQAGGAASWISLGSFTFQPAEFAKIALCVYLAAFFEKKVKEKKIKSLKESFFPFLIILSPFVFLLFLQPDLGTLGVLTFIAFLIFFGAGGSFSHIFLLALGSVLIFAIGMSTFGHASERVLTFLNPGEDALGKSYQVNQSLIALGSGGVFGVGLGNGIQKYNYLPEPMGDTIFAVWGEETGFIGSLAVVFLFLLFGLRGLIISKKAPDLFSRLLVIGIVGWIAIQTLFNIMAVSALIPFTGLPLPFMSYGGSSLILVLTGTGILINISRKTV